MSVILSSTIVKWFSTHAHQTKGRKNGKKLKTKNVKKKRKKISMYKINIVLDLMEIDNGMKSEYNESKQLAKFVVKIHTVSR